MIAGWKRQAIEGMAATFSGAAEATKAAGDLGPRRMSPLTWRLCCQANLPGKQRQPLEVELLLDARCQTDRLTGDAARDPGDDALDQCDIRKRCRGCPDRHGDRDDDQQYLPEHAARAVVVRFRLRRGRRYIPDRVVGVVRDQRACSVARAGDASRQRQVLAFAQRHVAGHAVGIGQLVPQARVAPDRLRDAPERLAGVLHGVAARRHALSRARDTATIYTDSRASLTDALGIRDGAQIGALDETMMREQAGFGIA